MKPTDPQKRILRALATGKCVYRVLYYSGNWSCLKIEGEKRGVAAKCATELIKLGLILPDKFCGPNEADYKLTDAGREAVAEMEREG